MLVGVLVSAIMGGMVGLIWSLTQQYGLPQTLASYPLGGLLSMCAFVLLSSLRMDPKQPHLIARD